MHYDRKQRAQDEGYTESNVTGYTVNIVTGYTESKECSASIMAGYTEKTMAAYI